MKMADIPGRIVKPLDKDTVKSNMGRPYGGSPIYNEARLLEVGQTMKVTLKRSGVSSRFKKSMPDKVFTQTRRPDHYEIKRTK